MNIFLFLFRNDYFHNVVSMFTNFVKLDVENYNVVSTLFNVIHVNVEIENVDSTFFDVVNSSIEIHNVDSTLSHVATSHQPKDNVETTLKCLLGSGPDSSCFSFLIVNLKRMKDFSKERQWNHEDFLHSKQLTFLQ